MLYAVRIRNQPGVGKLNRPHFLHGRRAVHQRALGQAKRDLERALLGGVQVPALEWVKVGLDAEVERGRRDVFAVANQHSSGDEVLVQHPVDVPVFGLAAQVFVQCKGSACQPDDDLETSAHWCKE